MQNSLRENYLKEGYIIFKSLISNKKINKILDELEIFKKNNKLYYSQSEHNWRKIKNDLDKFGLLECSFENFTDLPWGRELSKAGREILQSKEILDALRRISNYKDFCMWQNMFFDKSTGTIDHIDSWYLDTNPMGKLVAAWIALEDIDGEGGSFHIYPGSHLAIPDEWAKLNHNDFAKWSTKICEKFNKKPIYLKKGDILLWHPLLLHGSSSQKVKGKSRKSLTAHYHPINYLRGGRGLNEKMGTIKYKKALKKQISSSRNYGYEIFCRDSRRLNTKTCLGGALKYHFNLYNRPHMLMNRLKYNFKKNKN